MAVEEPARYGDFVNQLRRISDNLDELNRPGGKQITWANQQNDQAYTDQSNGMDWEPTPKVSSGSVPNTSRDDRPRAKWVTKEVLDQRRTRQECLRCGQNDHFIGKCRLAPASRPTSSSARSRRPARTATVSESAPKAHRRAKRKGAEVEELSSDSDLESDSGNE